MNLNREAQYFGIDPITLMDNMYNSVADYAKNLMKDIEKELLKHSTNDKENKQIIASLDKFSAQLKQIIDKNFDKFELYTLKKTL